MVAVTTNILCLKHAKVKEENVGLAMEGFFVEIVRKKTEFIYSFRCSFNKKIQNLEWFCIWFVRYQTRCADFLSMNHF